MSAVAVRVTLRYASDAGPGIRRVKARAGFRYVGPAGKALRDAAEVARIAALAIPPAWTGVWISPDPAGHLQATGRDAKGRKQYRYHPDWRTRRDRTKFGQLVAFGAALPRLRAAVAADLARPGLPREKVLAAVARLLDTLHLRVGNAEYAKANRSFGLSTLLDEHATIDGTKVRLKFRGKSGVWHDRAVSDRRLARVVRACRDLPGQDLFQFAGPDGEPHPVGSGDVNEYLRDATGGEFTAKVFRTWAGTVAAAVGLADRPPPASKTAGAKAVGEVVKGVAAELGNTPAVCRKSYVHPGVFDAYLGGTLRLARPARPPAGLTADEAAVLGFLGRAS